MSLFNQHFRFLVHAEGTAKFKRRGLKFKFCGGGQKLKFEFRGGGALQFFAHVWHEWRLLQVQCGACCDIVGC